MLERERVMQHVLRNFLLFPRRERDFAHVRPFGVKVKRRMERGTERKPRFQEWTTQAISYESQPWKDGNLLSLFRQGRQIVEKLGFEYQKRVRWNGEKNTKYLSLYYTSRNKKGKREFLYISNVELSTYIIIYVRVSSYFWLVCTRTSQRILYTVLWLYTLFM